MAMIFSCKKTKGKGDYSVNIFKMLWEPVNVVQIIQTIRFVKRRNPIFPFIRLHSFPFSLYVILYLKSCITRCTMFTPFGNFLNKRLNEILTWTMHGF